ncbi:MAG: Asp-tRNA(Asn)/Glu-tRNA(Gln) amidotransferase subunit GatB [Gemmatimonadetes bacterium]|nr:Asp-tRNA(Asn)/Glu-tRNA(Gln) amidotransferase subunit GatB [Gemmatimonadota bacterium]
MAAYEAVIGLEVHVQLRTDQKMFCADSAAFGAEPNTNVCPVCLGLPGALPVVNGVAVELAIRAALGLGCRIHETSSFSRKNYFYPDLPKGYQISQFDRPLATDGFLNVPGDDQAESRRVRIRRVHLEEDAGKSLHDRLPGATAVDLNRAGVPLIEIVSEPDLRLPREARAYLQHLKQLMEYLDVSDCNMEEGSLRVDANVSVRREGETGLGVKTEVKNLNSFSNVERALAFEFERQAAIHEAGGCVVHQTMLWDAGRGEARPMRAKEESHDYRYFADPDLPPLVVAREQIEATYGALPELPQARRRRFVEQYGVPDYDAGVLTATRTIGDYYEAVVGRAHDAKAASNWVMGPVLQAVNERGLDPRDPRSFLVETAALAELMALVADGTISQNVAKQVFQRMVESGRGAQQIVEAEGLAQVRDAGQLARWVDEAVLENPKEVERYRAGEDRLLAFFMGQVMRKSRGKADPRQTNELLREKLGTS